MIHRFIHTLLLLVLVTHIKAQQPNIDSLRHEIKIAQNDTIKITLFSTITDAYAETKPDSSVYFAEQLLMLARKLDLKLNEADALIAMAYGLLNIGNYPRALQISLSAIAIAEDPKSERNILEHKYLDLKKFGDHPVTPHILRLDVLARAHHYIGIVYDNANNYEKEKHHYLQAIQLAGQIHNDYELSTVYMTLGRVYLSLKKPDSALMYEEKAYDLNMQIGYKKYLGSVLLNLARIHFSEGRRQLAAEYFRRAITASYGQNYLRGVVAGNLALAEIFRQSGRIDSALHYANTGLQVAEGLNSQSLLLRCYTALATIYRTVNNKDSTVKYQELIITINDSLFNSKQVQQFQNIDFDEQQRRQEIEAAKKAYQNRLQVYLLLTGLSVFLLVAFILWRNNRQRQKAFNLLQKQKKEIDSQKEKVVATLNELKSTQAQLIQSEKMASLGELTAGIAHEIENPLNFINNFSEVNTELVAEMKDEIDKGNIEAVKSIASDIAENEQKINHHGKRADAIVKGMLQHSRTNTGQKELTDINSLAEEYLRLAYHGFRARDESLNISITTDFDKDLSSVGGKINIIPQDIARVLLNLYNNAFYAVTEKKPPTPPVGGEKNTVQNDYEPTVTVSTKSVKPPLGDLGVEIRVKDNGNGIPQKVLDKIFQPFFTTKPAGLGTGLGLSISYDIIKAHGGELKVETKEGEYAEFVISIASK